jgi:hypothetical protein
MECAICCKPYTKLQRVPVACPECEFAACTDCVKAYLLSALQDPHCMNDGCSRAFDDEFLDAHLSKSFRTGELKLHRQQTLLERQRALLPGRQHLAERETRRRTAKAGLVAAQKNLVRVQDAERKAKVCIQLHKDAVAHLKGKHPSWLSSRHHAGIQRMPCPLLSSGDVCAPCFARKCDVCSAIVNTIFFTERPAEDHVCIPVPNDKKERTRTVKAVQDALRGIRAGIESVSAAKFQVNEARQELWRAYNREEQQQHAEERKFVRACPVNACRGFLSTAWKCGTCSTWACANCHEVKGATKDAAHECNPDCVLTARLLDKETRPCPKCASAIFKISGCDQIWCTACNSAFDWRSGKEISNRVIHNPHYFEFLSRGGVVPDAVGRGGAAAAAAAGGRVCVEDALPNIHAFSSYIKRHCRSPSDDKVPGPASLGAGHLGAIQRGAISIDTNQRLSLLLLNHYRLVAHVGDGAERERLRRVAEEDQVRAEEELATQYLLGSIDQDKWKQQLQRLEKGRNKCVAFLQILDMYIHTSASVMHVHMAGNEKPQALLEHLDELRAYTQSALKAVGQRYQCVVPNVGL